MKQLILATTAIALATISNSVMADVRAIPTTKTATNTNPPSTAATKNTAVAATDTQNGTVASTGETDKNKDKPVPEGRFYLGFGGGYVITTNNSSTHANSNFVLNDPTGFDVGIYNLQNVNWKNRFKNGYELNIALGMRFCNNWRGEGEFLYQNIKRNISGTYDWRQVDSLGGDVFSPQLGNIISATEKTMNVYAWMANIYYDFKNCTKWTPFLGAGVGFATIKSTLSTAGDFLILNNETIQITDIVPTIENSPSLSGNVFAWQFKAGLTYQFDEHFSILGQYRLFGTTGYSVSGSNIKINPNSATAATFRIPGKDVHGLLSHGIDINFLYSCC